MQRTITSIITLASLVATSVAWAGIVFLPVGGQYQDPDTAPVEIQATSNAGTGIGEPSGVLSGGLNGHAVKVRTSGLHGKLTISGADLPPELGIPPYVELALDLTQQLELLINESEGTVWGRSSISALMDKASPLLALEGNIEGQGNATCLPLGGMDCGQIVVDLELRGALAGSDQASVASLQWRLLGSLIRDGHNAYWSALDASGTIGANPQITEELFGNWNF
jgi:hypothetical protein